MSIISTAHNRRVWMLDAEFKHTRVNIILNVFHRAGDIKWLINHSKKVLWMQPYKQFPANISNNIRLYN